MKVVVIWPYYPPEQGAASNRGLALVEALREHGADVTVAAPYPSYLVSTGSTPGGGSADIRIAAKLRSHNRSRSVRIVREILGALALPAATYRHIKDADVVIVSSPPLAFGVAGVLTAKAAGVTSVLDVRDPWPDVIIESGEVTRGILSGCAQIATRLAYRSATRISAVTKGTLENIECQGISRTKLMLVPNGIDRAVLEHATLPDSVRARRDQFRIVYSGLLGPAQGVEILFEALAGVRTPVRVDIFGEGIAEPKLRSAAGDINAEVRFHGLVPRDEAIDAMAKADAAFVPLASADMKGTVPSKLFEALGLGVPVLVVASGDAAEIAEESGAGFVSPPGDVESLRSRIEELIARRKEIGELGRVGREYVKTNYLRSQIFAAFAEQVGEVCRRQDGSIRPRDRRPNLLPAVGQDRVYTHRYGRKFPSDQTRPAPEERDLDVESSPTEGAP